MTITSMFGIIDGQVNPYGLLYAIRCFDDSCKCIQVIDFIGDKVGTAGFEPTASCTPSKKIPFSGVVLNFPACSNY